MQTCSKGRAQAQAVALALYGDYRAPSRAADAAEARRLQAAFAARVRGMHARYEHGTLFQGEAAPGCIADGTSAADGCATYKRIQLWFQGLQPAGQSVVSRSHLVACAARVRSMHMAHKQMQCMMSLAFIKKKKMRV